MKIVYTCTNVVLIAVHVHFVSMLFLIAKVLINAFPSVYTDMAEGGSLDNEDILTLMKDIERE